MPKILLTGAHGMLATAFIHSASDGLDIIAYDRATLDITDVVSVERIISAISPDIIINMAAYNDVDEAEGQGRDQCLDTNTTAVENLAKMAKKYSADFITFSTDYVYDGSDFSGYVEDAHPHPLSVYGMSKYLGQKLAREAYPETIVIRTSWLYSGTPGHDDFVAKICSLAETERELRVVDDQYGSPTSTHDLALALREVIDHISDYRARILHLSGDTGGKGVTWYTFAREICTTLGRRVSIIPCTSIEYPTRAERPKHSVLINTSDIVMRDWKIALHDALRQYHHIP